MKNPNQPIVWAEDGCIRFKKNKIVDAMLDVCTKHGFSLNDICVQYDVGIGEKDNDDYTQLMQLIGYSVSGYGDLSTSPDKLVCRFDAEAAKMSKKRSKK